MAYLSLSLSLSHRALQSKCKEREKFLSRFTLESILFANYRCLARKKKKKKKKKKQKKRKTKGRKAARQSEQIDKSEGETRSIIFSTGHSVSGQKGKTKGIAAGIFLFCATPKTHFGHTAK